MCEVVNGLVKNENRSSGVNHGRLLLIVEAPLTFEKHLQDRVRIYLKSLIFSREFHENTTTNAGGRFK